MSNLTSNSFPVGSPSIVSAASNVEKGEGKLPYTIESFSSFDDMTLAEKLLRGIYAYGFEKPSVIQQRAIVPFAQGYDVIAQAQSGTGKTGTYSIGLLQRIDCSIKELQALVLVPTR